MIGRNHCYVVNSCELVILVLSLYVKCCLLFSVSVFSIFQPKFDTAVLKLLVKRKTPVNVKNPNNPEIGAFQQMALSCLMVTIFLVRKLTTVPIFFVSDADKVFEFGQKVINMFSGKIFDCVIITQLDRSLELG